jgi:hypothetical protein
MKFGIRCYYCKTCNKLYAVEEYNNSFNPDYRGYVGLVLGVSGTGIILLLLSRYKYEDNTSEVKK